MPAASTISFQDLARAIADHGAHQRCITAIAGPPGSGKSTLAARLAEQLNARDPDSAAVVPLDGFHFDDAVLRARGDLARKGAPHTFDVGGLKSLLARIRRNDEPFIAAPVFDRSLEIARAGARIIPPTARHIVVEGNYLLLTDAPWRDLNFDLSVFLPVPLAELERRLAERWSHLPPAEARAKLSDNDLPNAELVLSESRAADFFVDAEQSA
ncbi:MAG: hypothetical protein AAF580_10510 [Pseudomonadota bacterium]